MFLKSSPVNFFPYILQHYYESRDRKQKFDQVVVLIITLVSFVFSYLAYILIDRVLINAPVSRIFSLLFTLLCILVGSKTLPQLFNVLIVVVSVLSPLIICDFQNDIFISFILSTLGPVFALILTNSHKCFVGSILIHLLNFNTRFKEQFIGKMNTIELDEYDDFVEKSFMVVSIQICLSMVIYWLMDLTSQKCIDEVIHKDEEMQAARVSSYKAFEETCSQLSNSLRNLYSTIDFSIHEQISTQVVNTLKSVQTSIKLFRNEMNNTLAYEKMEFQKLEIQPIPARTSDWISELWLIVSEMLKDKRPMGILKLQRKVPPLLYLDSVRIQQVLLNLLQYSMEKTKRGTINMTVEWLDSELLNEKCFEPIPYNYEEEGVFEKKETLHMLDMKNAEKSLDRYQVFKSIERGIEFEHCNYAQKIAFGTLKVTVWDNSPGLTEDKVNSFFEPDAADSSMPGLKRKAFKVSKEICKQMDGEIRMYSKEGIGTTFVACFPIPTYGFSQAYPNVRDSIIRIRRKKLNVMIGNIDPTFHFQIASDLKSLEATVVAKASNVSEFFVSLVELSVESKRPVDLVIIDLSMPHLDAPVFCERLRNQERKNQLGPVYILLTGEIEKNDMITSLLNRNNLGYINKYLKRPFDFYSLLESLFDLCSI